MVREIWESMHTALELLINQRTIQPCTSSTMLLCVLFIRFV